MNTLDQIQEPFVKFYQDLLGKQLIQRCVVKSKIIDEGPRLTEDHHKLLNFNIIPCADVKRVLWLILMGTIANFSSKRGMLLVAKFLLLLLIFSTLGNSLKVLMSLLSL